MEITEENTTQNEEQEREVRDNLITNFHDELQRQIATIDIPDEEDDKIVNFINNYFNYQINDDLESREIYVDEVMKTDPYNRDDLFKICDMINNFFDSYWGIRLADNDIYHLHNLYKVMVLNFKEYFIYYINGIQVINRDPDLLAQFCEDVPNFAEYSYDYYLEHVSSIKKEQISENDALKIPVIKNYINYILELGVNPELYFEIALQESEGDVTLSDLYVESVNNGIVYDNEFINLKFKRLLELESCDSIVSRLIDFF